MYGELPGQPISDRVKTVRANLVDFDPPDHFDDVWSNGSLEHVAPVDAFLSGMHRWLRPGGTAIICNDNALNPLRHLMVIRERGSWRREIRMLREPVTGEPMLWANENIHVPASIARRLRAIGFRNVRTTYQSVVPSFAVRSDAIRHMAEAMEKLSNIPVLSAFLAGDCTITGTC